MWLRRNQRRGAERPSAELFGRLPAAARMRSCDIFMTIFMPTTVHVPPALLKSVDRRAKALGLSRNRMIVRALEQAVSDRSRWAPEFLQRLRAVDRATAEAVEELINDVKRGRRSKRPPAL